MSVDVDNESYICTNVCLTGTFKSTVYEQIKTKLENESIEKSV